MTRRLVAEFGIRQDGALRDVPFKPFYEAVLRLARSAPFRPTTTGILVATDQTPMISI